ncbi:hypothetical protein P5_0005 [Aeromonas phage P5]|nr:hypothetical protein P5_0005 [Aeromonas phage P5]
MEQTNKGSLAQVLEGLAKLDARDAVAAEVSVERQIELAVAEIVPSGNKSEVYALTYAMHHALENGATIEQAIETAKATKALGTDPAYFDPAVPFVADERDTVHPLAVEVSTKMQGLTAEEVLAGLMPELSALYRERDNLLEQSERQSTAINYYLRELERIHRELDTSNEEVSFAYRAGQDVEKTLGHFHADLVRMETNNSLLSQQAGVFKADLQVIHGMMLTMLMRNIPDKDAAAAEERANRYYRMTALELAQEVVFASTNPEQFVTNFGSRVADMRKSMAEQLAAQAKPMAQATDGGSNEQSSSAEGLLQGQ